MREIKEKAKFCFLKLFEEVHNDRPHLAVQMQTGEPNESRTYFKPIFSDLKKAIFIVNQILETVRVADNIIFYYYLAELVHQAIEREPDERTSAKLGKETVERRRQIKIKFSNWLSKKIPLPDPGTHDLFVSKDTEKLFMDCGIKHQVFSSNREYLRKKGFAFGMMEAFNKENLVKFKASSRTLIKLFFKHYLGSSFNDPRRIQKGAGSFTFQDGYDAAIRFIEDNNPHS